MRVCGCACGGDALWNDSVHRLTVRGTSLNTRVRSFYHIQEAWVSFEMVYTTTVDRRQRAVVLQREFVEAVASATETADLSRFSFDAREAARRSPRVEARQCVRLWIHVCVRQPWPMWGEMRCGTHSFN